MEVPVGDFFGMGWGQYAHLNSLAICVNPGRAFNSYWQMPFRKKCKITIENIDTKPTRLYYQIDYTLTEIPADAAYFHAQFRSPDPDHNKEAYTIIDVNGQYTEFTTPYAGLHQVIRPDGAYQANARFGLYRWHITDPVRFEKDLRITIQDLGWRSDGRYLKQGSDISSVAIWYKMEPHAPFPKLPSKDELEVR